MSKLPIGIQDFPQIRKEKFLYVDKTQLIYDLVTNGVSYFLTRPRRFGKSLLVSTLETLFKGERKLFSGLWIDSSPYEWKKYPVVRLDLSKTISSSPEALSNSLQELIAENGRKYDVTGIERPYPSLSLNALVIELFKRGPVVILIDEYDKPLVSHLENMELVAKNREILAELYTTIKALGEYIHRVFITGVSKFSKVSLFSGMNNLIDLSISSRYATLLGLTEDEIARTFGEDIELLSKKWGKPSEEIFKNLQLWYNGYAFSRGQDDPKVYNPLSLLQFLDSGEFDNYWFTTATPTFAINLIKRINFPIPDLEEGVIVGKEIETNHEVDVIDLPTLLFQTGYLTIAKYDPNSWTYFLKFPNKEVKTSFLQHLLLGYVELKPSEIHSLIYKLIQNVNENNFADFFEQLNSLFASVPYHIHLKEEKYYHSLIYLILKVLGFSVEAEVSTGQGRTDMVLKTKKYISIFEFKINSDAESALKQIIDRKYFKCYQTDPRQKLLIGVNFDTASRSINEWKSQPPPST